MYTNNGVQDTTHVFQQSDNKSSFDNETFGSQDYKNKTESTIPQLRPHGSSAGGSRFGVFGDKNKDLSREDNQFGITRPSPFSSSESNKDAKVTVRPSGGKGSFGFGIAGSAGTDHSMPLDLPQSRLSNDLFSSSWNECRFDHRPYFDERPMRAGGRGYIPPIRPISDIFKDDEDSVDLYSNLDDERVCISGGSYTYTVKLESVY